MSGPKAITADRRRVWWKGTYAQFRWNVKRFGWRQLSIITPVVWRWSLYGTVRLLPRGPWFLGVSFGRDEIDDDPFVRLGLLLVEADVQAAECASYDDYDAIFGGSG